MGPCRHTNTNLVGDVEICSECHVELGTLVDQEAQRILAACKEYLAAGKARAILRGPVGWQTETAIHPLRVVGEEGGDFGGAFCAIWDVSRHIPRRGRTSFGVRVAARFAELVAGAGLPLEEYPVPKEGMWVLCSVDRGVNAFAVAQKDSSPEDLEYIFRVYLQKIVGPVQLADPIFQEQGEGHVERRFVGPNGAMHRFRGGFLPILKAEYSPLWCSEGCEQEPPSLADCYTCALEAICPACVDEYHAGHNVSLSYPNTGSGTLKG